MEWMHPQNPLLCSYPPTGIGKLSPLWLHYLPGRRCFVVRWNVHPAPLLATRHPAGIRLVMFTSLPLSSGICNLSERVTATPLVPSRTLFGTYRRTLRHRPPPSLSRFPFLICVHAPLMTSRMSGVPWHLGPSSRLDRDLLNICVRLTKSLLVGVRPVHRRYVFGKAPFP